MDDLYDDALLLAKTLHLAVDVIADKLDELDARIAKADQADQAEELYAPEWANVEEELGFSIVAEEVTAFKYRDAEGVTSYRVVSPYELAETLSPEGSFYSLVGWDHGREGIRRFRVERIEGMPTATDAEDYREPDDA